jgi:hypothetical protein
MNSRDWELCSDEYKDPWRDEIIDIVRNGLWLSTTCEGFLGIVDKGLILPSSLEREPFSYPQTKNSYAAFKGYVAVFDFRAATDEQICDHYDMKWDGFFPMHSGLTIVLRLNRTQLKRKLIPNNRAQEEVGNKKVWIPYVEAWHPEPISVKAVCGALVLGWKKDNTTYHKKNNFGYVKDLQQLSEDLKDLLSNNEKNH